MRPKSLILLTLALGSGLVAAVGINQVLATRTGEQPTTIETESIVVAVADIPMGEPINAQVIRLEQWPKNRIPADSLTKLEDAVGRVTRTRILKDEPIREGRLGTGNTAVELIPKGYRVMAVWVDNSSGCANLILPGNRVDVLCYLRSNTSAHVPFTGTRTILEDVKVFAVNDIFMSDEVNGESRIAAKTISLLVTPEQAEKVALASELGKISLTLRSPEDDRSASPPGTDVSALLTTDKSDRVAHKISSADRALAKQENGLLSMISKAAERFAATSEDEGAKETQPKEPKAPAVEKPARPAVEFAMLVIEGADVRMYEFQKDRPLPTEASLSAPMPAAGALPGGAALPAPPPGLTPPAPTLPEINPELQDQAERLNQLLEPANSVRLQQ